MKRSVIAATFAGTLASGFLMLSAPVAHADCMSQFKTSDPMFQQCIAGEIAQQQASSGQHLPDGYAGSAGPDGKCTGWHLTTCIPPCNMISPELGAIPTGQSPCSDTGKN
jgi:hypothetical protein